MSCNPVWFSTRLSVSSMPVAANAAGVALKTTAVTAARDTACARAIKSSTRAIASSHATRARASDDARARGTTIDRECDSDPRPARMCARVDVERASVDAIARLRSGAIRSVEIHSIVRARPGRRKRVGRVDACAIESHHHHRSRSYQPSIARSRVRTLFAEALTTVFALTDFEVVIFWTMALPVKADVDAATDMVERSCAMRSAGRAGRARDRIEVAADSRSLGGGGGGGSARVRIRRVGFSTRMSQH